MQRFLIFIALLACFTSVSGQNSGTAKKPQSTQSAAKTSSTPSQSAAKASESQSATKKQPTAGNGYAYPVRNVAGLYSANFGEIRPGHFHTGVDIKTEGAVGFPAIAVADGYISRVTISSGGFGRALYLVLSDGTTAVYGHMLSFRDDIERLVDAERRTKHSNDADLWFAPGQFPVRRGETIARTGNSGSSGGPHLHFELRDTEGRFMNIVRTGIIRPDDTIPPIIMRLHYAELDTVQGVPVLAPLKTYNAALTGGGHYRLQHKGPVITGRKGYFVLETSDRRNGVQNTFGVYRISLFVDGDTRFEFRIDAIPAGYSRYSDAVSFYPLQIATRNEAIRLAQTENTPGWFFPKLKERGLIRTVEGETRRIRIEAEDDCGNLSTLEFDIRGGTETFRAEADSTAVVLRPDRPTTVRQGDDLTAFIPAGALYEPLFCHPERLEPSSGTQGVVILSSSYKILDATTPLLKPMTVTICAPVPRGMEKHAALAGRTRKGELAYIGGKYADGALTAQTRMTGELLVVADTLAPIVTPLFKEDANLARNTILRFRANDNFSGIAAWTLRIDGVWAPCDRFPVKGTLVHTFAIPASGRRHNAELSVSDACGNTSQWSGTFYR